MAVHGPRDVQHSSWFPCLECDVESVMVEARHGADVELSMHVFPEEEVLIPIFPLVASLEEVIEGGCVGLTFKMVESGFKHVNCVVEELLIKLRTADVCADKLVYMFRFDCDLVCLHVA